MRKTFKYRLYPTKEQAESLQWILDRCRELYNAALQERRDAYRMCGKSIYYYDQQNQLPEIKEIREEYKQIGSHVLQNVLRRVDLAFKAFFRRISNGEKEPGYPRFQGKGRYDSFCFPDAAGWKLSNCRLSITNLGSIKIKLHRELTGKIKTCTVKREGTHWYATFSCEIEEEGCRLPYTDEAVGIDLGITHFAALSTGDFIDNPRCYRRSEKKIARIQKELARKKKRDSRTGCKGNRRKKCVQRLSKAYRKVRNQRSDFLHQWSRRLVNTYEAIIFEDLAPSHMSKRPKPKKDDTTGQYLPNGASAKGGLNKSILDAGWNQFVQYVTYKAENAGTVQVVLVDPRYTSQVCSKCGTVRKKTLDERWHSCECGCSLDRDHNAAINIKQKWLGRSLQVLACEAPSV